MCLLLAPLSLSLHLSLSLFKFPQRPNPSRKLAVEFGHCEALRASSTVPPSPPCRSCRPRARNRGGRTGLELGFPILFLNSGGCRRQIRPPRAPSVLAVDEHASRVSRGSSQHRFPLPSSPGTGARRRCSSAAAGMHTGVAPVVSGKRRRHFVVARVVVGVCVHLIFFARSGAPDCMLAGAVPSGDDVRPTSG